MPDQERVAREERHRSAGSTRQTERSTRQEAQRRPAGNATETTTPVVPGTATTLLGDSSLQGRGTAPVRAALMLQAQQTYGNRALRRAVQRARKAAPEGSEGAAPGLLPAVQRNPPTTADPVAQEQALAISDQHLLGGLERWLQAETNINPATVDWKAEIPKLRNSPPFEPETLVQASDLDRYDLFLQMLQAEAASRPPPAGAVEQAGALEGILYHYLFDVLKIAAFAHDAPRVHSQKFLSHWLAEMGKLKFVPDGFDLGRFRPAGDYAASGRRALLENVLMNRDGPRMMTLFVLDEWTKSNTDPETWLKNLDLNRYRQRLIQHLTSEVMGRAKKDPYYKGLLRDAAIEQTRFEAVVAFSQYAYTFAQRTRTIGKALATTPIEDLDPAYTEVADDPYGFYQSSSAIAQATQTTLANLNPYGPPDTEIIEGVAGILAAVNLPPGLAGFLEFAKIGQTIHNMRELNKKQEAEAEQRISKEVEVRFSDIAEIVRAHAKYAAEFIDRQWIPMLKKVALERVKANRDELQKTYNNWDKESDTVASRYLLAAMQIDEMVDGLRSGKNTAVEIDGKRLTRDDIKDLETVATFLRDEAAVRMNPKKSKERRETVKEAIDGYAEVAENINNGKYDPLDYSASVYVEARGRLGIGEFPEGTTVYGAMLGGAQASREPFLAESIVEWKWREGSERAALEFLKFAGLTLLSITALSVSMVLGPGAWSFLLGAVDFGVNEYAANKQIDDAKDLLRMARLDPGGTVRGVSVDEAEAALKNARIGFWVPILIFAGLGALHLAVHLAGGGTTVSPRLTRLSALAKADPRLAQKLMAMVKDSHKLEELLGHVGKAADLESLLARTTGVRQLESLLAHVKDAQQLTRLLDRAQSATQLEKLLDAVGGNVARLEKLAAKAGSLSHVESLLARVGDARRLEGLLEHMHDGAQLDRLLTAAGNDVARLEHLLKLASPTELEELLKLADVAQVERLQKAGLTGAQAASLLKKAASAAQVTKLLDAVGGNIARLEKLAAKVAHLSELEKLLAHVGDIGRLEELLKHMQDGAQLDRLLTAAGNDVSRLEHLLKLAAPTELEGLLKLASAADLEQLQKAGFTGAQAERMLKDMGSPTLVKLAKSLPAKDIEALSAKLGKDSLTDLSKDLSGKTIQHLAADLKDKEISQLLKQLDKDALSNLAEGMSGKEIQGLVKANGKAMMKWLGTDLTGTTAKEVLANADVATLKQVQDISAKEFKALQDTIRAPSIKLLAPALKGKGLQALNKWDFFTFASADDAIIKANGGAAKSLGSMEGKTLAQVRTELHNAGFSAPTPKGGQKIYTHADGSVVRVKDTAPYGPRGAPHVVREISRTPGASGKTDIVAKLTEDGRAIPAEGPQAETALDQWFNRETGRPPDASKGERGALQDAWADAGHINVKP